MTGNVSFVRHLYKVQRELKTYTVYELQNCTKDNAPTPPILTDLIRVEVFRGCSYGKGFLHYLRVRNTTAWAKCKLITGLIQTDSTHLFFGDHKHKGKRHLIIFTYSQDKNKLCIDYYPDFYPNRDVLTALLTKYKQVYKK